MPNVNVSIPYSIPQDEALSRIHARIGEIKAQYSGQVSNLTENWYGYSGALSGSSHGFTVLGNLVVSPSLVTVVIELPFIAFACQTQVEAGVRDELTKLLASKNLSVLNMGEEVPSPAQKATRFRTIPFEGTLTRQ
jgi:Putative polyhydroxyalkanoic acid system protein (PHA_gran_rgn)